MKQTKNKTTAVILAVLFGVFGWIYTWRSDSWKFWVGLLMSTFGWFIFFPPFIAYAWVIIDQVRKPQKYYNTYFD